MQCNDDPDSEFSDRWAWANRKTQIRLLLEAVRSGSSLFAIPSACFSSSKAYFSYIVITTIFLTSENLRFLWQLSSVSRGSARPWQ